MNAKRSCRARGSWVAGLVGVLALGARLPAAHAVVTEPNGLAVPITVPQVEVDLAAGFTPSSVVSLPALFQARGENVDYKMDALTTPGVFSPVCGFSGELVLHGGACHIDFGWYNADPASTTPPPDSEIYTIIPGTMIISPWHPGVGEDGPIFTTDTIRNDPHYLGGLIGFALKGDAGSDCKQTHFSEQSKNVLCTNCTPQKSWAAAVIWQSTKTPNAYYIGFEDLGMSPTDFGGLPGQPYRNDGDFNDFVYFLSGLTCDGGGTPCDTKMPGVCAAGLNECATGTTLACRQSVTASTEVCDGLDNDCNGMVDDKAPCAADRVCDRGVCVPPCSASEFPCAPGDTCKNGLCVDSACVDVTCDAGKLCIAGVCKAPCDGVTCPGTQVCRIGRCTDPCQGVTCGSDRVCDGGICVASCKCRSCEDGKVCDTSGACVDSGCTNKTCATGEVCSAGACVDACAHAVCPRGQECKAGGCVDTVAPAGGAGSSGAAGRTGGGGSTGTGGSTSRGDVSVDGIAIESPRDRITPSSGCRCDAGPASRASGWWGIAVVAALVAARRRRRRGAPPPPVGPSSTRTTR
jgi:MYXO-CTERM domain-containing protein